MVKKSSSSIVSKDNYVEFSSLAQSGGKIKVHMDDLQLVRVSNGRIALSGKSDDGLKVFRFLGNEQVEQIKDDHGKRIHPYKK
jgi:hypothetical protein